MPRVEMSQQYIKNTNTPPTESELYTVGDGWKISASGKTYTSLEEIYRNKVNPESEDNVFYNTLIEQLTGKVTEPIDYIGYYFVATVAADLKKELVYAYTKDKLDLANKQVKYSFNADSDRNKGDDGNSTTVPKAQQQTQFKPQQTFTPPVTTTPATKPTISQRTIEIVKDVRPIAWDNAMEIEKAEEEGLYILPIVHVGKENFFFKNQNDEYCFLYGRIINVKVSDN